MKTFNMTILFGVVLCASVQANTAALSLQGYWYCHAQKILFPLVLLSCGSCNLSGLYTIVISEPWRGFGDTDDPFRAENSIDIYFLILDKL